MLTPTRVAEVNRSHVIQLLCDHGPMTRHDLESLAGGSRTEIEEIVDSLIATGLLEDRDGSDQRLWFGPRGGLSGGVVIGEGTYESALVNARGDLIEHAMGEFDPEDMSGHAVGLAAREGLSKVLPRNGSEVLGVGVAVPGFCDTSTGEVLGSGQVPALRGMRFAQQLSAVFGSNVLIDNDSHALALGEKWFGAGRGHQTFASVQTGSGLGVGLVLNGAIYRGPFGTAGEVGHTAVVPRGERCTCGLSGCWETIATLRWLRQEAEQAQLPGAARMTATTLRALSSESRAARRLMEDYADHIALGLANLTHVLGVTRFILHGDAVGGGEDLRMLIVDHARERTFPGLRDRIEIVTSELDQRAAVLGAAGLVLSSAFDLRT